MKKQLLIIWTVLFYSMANAQNPLFIPHTVSGENIDLHVQYGQMTFYEGFVTHTIGYNQEILGPTIVLEKGQNVTLNVWNELNEVTTVHWHGLHVSAKNDGGPHTVIEAGAVWSPSFTVLDHAATYWYHPHLHEHTEEQVTMGGTGFIIVRDETEAELELPRTYGVDDFPIVIQSKAFDVHKQFVTQTAADDVILCNGTLHAFLEVPAQVVRLRLLNGSTERVYNLGFHEAIDFYQIATDGGLLSAPVSLNRLQLAPGERAEILLDLGAYHGHTIQMMSFGSELSNGIYGASNPSAMPMGSIAGYSDNSLNGSDFEVLSLAVVEATPHAVNHIPTSLIEQSAYLESSVDETRNLTFRPAQMGPVGMLNGPFEINGQEFDMEVINYEIPLDNTEVWELTNMTGIAHPFHIHDVQFYILDINGNPPPQNMAGRKDVVLVPAMNGTVRFITKFEDFADVTTPYMYHCHMLSHEDDGMMGQFVVRDFSTSIENYNSTSPSISILTNPIEGKTIQVKGVRGTSFSVYNSMGQLVNHGVLLEEMTEIDLSNYAEGIYFFRVETPNGFFTHKIII